MTAHQMFVAVAVHRARVPRPAGAGGVGRRRAVSQLTLFDGLAQQECLDLRAQLHAMTEQRDCLHQALWDALRNLPMGSPAYQRADRVLRKVEQRGPDSADDEPAGGVR